MQAAKPIATRVSAQITGFSPHWHRAAVALAALGMATALGQTAALAQQAPAAPAAVSAPASTVPAAVSGRGTMPWPDRPYPYVILDQDIRDVLAAFGSNLDVPVKVSDKVTGRVRGRLPQLTPQQLLDHLAASYGLQWYYDGQVLYVTTVEEAASEMVPLGAIGFEELQASLASLHLDDPRFPLRPLLRANVALVSGPPRYVALVKETMQALQQAYQFQTTIVRGRIGKPGS
jgi:type II secretory pathway component GspD/PulD (secretin)